MTPDAAALALARDVSRETLERLGAYAALLEKWNPRINLVSKGTISDLWMRHFRDSAQLLNLAPDGVTSWCDLGSGGGFPGMVVAVLASETRPNLHVSLIEADQRKVAFLRTVARETGADVTILPERIEAAPEQGAAIVSARALAPLPALFDLVERHLRSGGSALLPKGARYAEELRESLALWRFRCETVPSETDPAAVILNISELTRA